MALFSELKRRNVLRMAVLYVAAAWLLLQVVGVLIDLDVAPVSIGPVTFKILAIGLPIALMISWYFEITPEGIKRERDVERAESITRLTGRRMDFIVIAILVAALGVFAFDKWWIATDRPSLAILPCLNLGKDAAAESFVMGLHEDLLTNTAGIKGLRVISRTSVDQYRNTVKTIPEIGKELGVNHLLECGVQRVKTDQGDRVRVNAQLIQAKFDEHLWAEKYDRVLTAENLFRVQEDIARAVAGTLRVRLTEEEEAKLKKAPTENTAAYEAYLRGRAGLHQTQDPEAARQAIEDLQQAVDMDPEFAMAYAELAQQIAIFVKFGNFPAVEEAEHKKLIARARHAANTALKFDDSLAAAYVALGFLAEERALKKLAYKRAIDLDPNYDRAYVPYAHHLARDGKIEEGIVLLRKAVGLCPRCADYYAELGHFLADAGRPEEGEVELKKAIELDPSLASAHFALAELDFFHTGRLDEALIHWRQGYAFNPTNPWTTAIIAKVYADLGGREEALAFLTRAQELRPDGLGVWPMFLYMNLGDREMGLEVAREILERPPGFGFENAVTFLDYQDVREGRVDEALARMRRYFPHVTVAGDLAIDSTNNYQVAHYAWLLDQAGQAERSQDLLEGCLNYLESKDNMQGFEAEHRGRVLIMLGRQEEGLATLESAYARFRPAPVERFRFDQPIYDPVRDTDRFQNLVAKYDGDAARQLARLRQMERKGELPPAPGVRDWNKITAAEQHP
jgi:TolB-like protein/tetratricopeptide (TPR) repeat protein